MESNEPNTITNHPVNCEVTLSELQHIKRYAALMVRCNPHVLYIKNEVSGIRSSMKNDALVLFGVTAGTTSIKNNKCEDLFIRDTTGYY